MKSTLPQPPTQDQAIKLPAWRNCAEAIASAAIDYGDTIPASWVSAWLRVSPAEQMRYGTQISKIRARLEEDGFYLIQKEDGSLLVAQPEHNVSKVAQRNRASLKLLKRAVLLGESTDASKLDDANRRLLEHENNKAATRLALMGRRALAG